MTAATASFPEAQAALEPPPAELDGQQRYTRQRMERILAIVVAVGATGLGLQAAIAALGDIRTGAVGETVLLTVVLVMLAAMVVACLVGRGVRPVSGAFAITYAVALALWPSIVDGGEASRQPWIFFLVNIAAVAAIVAFPMRFQAAAVVLLPFLYGYVRIAQGDFEQGFWIATAFDVSFTLILGGVLLALAWVFRAASANIDEARGVAVASYAEAAADAAAEEERVAVAALMHDSVLAALIAAERAESDRERELAVGMAREALTRLANTEEDVAREGGDAPIAGEQVVIELRRLLSEAGADAIVEVHGETSPLPERVARATVLAARQAVTNAIEHAGGRGLHVLLRASTGGGFTLTVSDTGPGFDLASVPEDRLGIRASIVARMAAVAGGATIDSGPDGTVVTLTWHG